MRLSYFHVSEDVPSNLAIESAVVIDVLRATTTIACALKNGAESIRTFADIDQLKKEAYKCPVNSRILLGERGGKKLTGFDLGNSPVDVVSEVVRNKSLFMSTTNGTRALDRVIKAKHLYTVALPNRLAVAEKLLSDEPSDLCLLGSGWEGTYSLEDSLAAGALASFLLESSPNLISIVNDEMSAALALWEQCKNDPEVCLRKSTHGKRLMKIGNHDADFKFCSQLDQLNVVPMQVEPGVLKSS